MIVSRRAFLGVSGLAVGSLMLQEDSAPDPQGPLYDFHVHLFGIGDGRTGCFLSDKQRGHPNYSFFLHLLGLSENGRFDQDYVNVLVRQFSASSMTKAVLLSYDGRYDRQGRFDRAATNVYVPNEYLFRVVAEYPDLFIPCVSINPNRRDAMEELDRCAASGARVLKIHPPTQNVDPADVRFRPFYRRLAEHGIVLMVHTGGEDSSEVVCPSCSDTAQLVPALEEGCTVIAAHSGMFSFYEKEDFFPTLVEMIGRFPNLYCDSSILASVLHWRSLPRILRETAALDRLVHASDWPFPSNPLVFWNRLPLKRLLGLCAETNIFERDYRLKQAVGLPTEVFERGARLLA